MDCTMTMTLTQAKRMYKCTFFILLFINMNKLSMQTNTVTESTEQPTTVAEMATTTVANEETTENAVSTAAAEATTVESETTAAATVAESTEQPTTVAEMATTTVANEETTDNAMSTAAAEATTEATTERTGVDAFFNFGIQADDYSFFSLDEGSVFLILRHGFEFFGSRHNILFININGYISLGSRVDIVPRSPISSQKNIISPLGMDLDLTGSNGTDDTGVIYYNKYEHFDYNAISNASVKDMYDRIKTEVTNSYGDVSFVPSMVAVVTWIKCPRFPYLNSTMAGESASFQLVLTEDYRRQRSYIFFVYGSIMMTSSDIENFQGYSASSGSQFELPTSNIMIIGLDKFTGNTGKPGMWIFRTSSRAVELQADSPEYSCLSWAVNQNLLEMTLSDILLPSCPCTYIQATVDGLYLPMPGSGRNGCVVSSRVVFGRVTRMCCYLSTTTGDQLYGVLDVSRTYAAGSMLKYHPFLYLEEYRQFDDVPKKKCCSESNNCGVFYQYRPSDNCFNYLTPIFSYMWGDPHIATIDGKKYSYQGLGNFWLLKGDTVQVQAKTKRIQTANGALSRGTVWSGIAVKDVKISDNTANTTQTEETTINVQLTSDSTGLEVLLQDADLTTWFNKNGDPDTKQHGTLFIRKNDDTLTVQLYSGIAIQVKPGDDQLVLGIIMPRELQKLQLAGLLGNANGNPEDDFQLPDGTVLSSDLSQEDIYYKFGEQWRIPSGSPDSLFFSVVPDKQDGYSPIFTDKMPVSDNIKKLCGDDPFCVSDMLITENTEFSLQTKRVNGIKTENKINIEKAIPTIVGPAVMHVTIGRPTSIRIYSNNTKTNVVLTADFDMPEGATFDASTGTFTWNPPSYVTSPVNIIFGDKDNTAVRLPVTVILCNCTEDRGTCTGDILSQVSGYNFQVDECECKKQYTGEYCSEEKNFCDDSPCTKGATCVPIPIDQQKAGSPGYNCTDCPAGYAQVVVADFGVSKCTDIDECSVDADNDCDQKCINTEGSYRCECNSGYRKYNDTACEDIDECQMSTSNCDQVCQNKPGSYQCTCYDGFTMTNDNCVPDDTTRTACASLNCEYGCRLVSNKAECFCQPGYTVSETTCVDIDECQDGTNSCDSNSDCKNTKGSYTCECHTGYIINPDQRTCRPCDPFFWGDNCANECKKCVNVSSCDNVQGCKQCFSGWTGPSCETDIDECAENPCGEHSSCENHPGTYRCNCDPGYKSTIQGCEEIDECSEDNGSPRTSNPCNNGTCTDRLNTFTCQCLPGYTGDVCLENIDECIDNRCEHNSMCVDGINSYSCLCKEGFTGMRCEEYVRIQNPVVSVPAKGDYFYAGNLLITSEQWSDDLNDPETPRYQDLYNRTILKIILIHSTLDDNTKTIYKGVRNVAFSRGSVRVSWLLYLSDSVDAAVLANAINARRYLFDNLTIENVTYTEMPQDKNKTLYIAVGTVGAIVFVALLVFVILFLLWKRGKLNLRGFNWLAQKSANDGYDPSLVGWTTGMRAQGRYWQEAPSLRSSDLSEQPPKLLEYYDVSIPRPQLQETAEEINWKKLADFQGFTKPTVDLLGRHRYLPEEYAWTLSKSITRQDTIE